MSRAGASTMLVIAVLWAVTPTVACLLSTQPMMAAEHECCEKMAQQCGSAVMPSSHACCQHPNQRDAAISPVATYSSTRHFSVAVVPHATAILIDSSSNATQLPALEAPPSEASPGRSSVLRI